ncbi:hypothetical protein QA601_18125 [Chitinispirillales bacterium ANBcel5]|uniref:hypothetical protein n=1 Tax=Cellulosispirillum alkaliphilum TaxID=3039283 RepID=UPI002A557BAF|nr:hypothetical protein [Chitinispirillales bacterium ANBcel5]
MPTEKKGGIPKTALNSSKFNYIVLRWKQMKVVSINRLRGVVMGSFSKKAILLVIALSMCVFADVAPQTVQDSMDGNWLVINGQRRFISGMNIAWIDFANDVGDTRLDINAFRNKIRQIRSAGGNAVRWWLHTDASRCPTINSDGEVTGIGSRTIENMRQALDTAYAYGVVVSMCLFSFDLLVPGDQPPKSEYSDFDLESNHQFLTVPENLDTYLENGLGPILEAVGDHPAIMCWEVFNEAEGMLASAGWDAVVEKITQDDILRITNRIAGFVRSNTNKMVSTGMANPTYHTMYSDEALINAGGDENGWLDFYMMHYYPEWYGENVSPFHNPASHWNMDRPVLIGEFMARGWTEGEQGPKQQLMTTKSIIDAYQHTYDKGYAGALSWSMTEGNSDFFGDFSTTAPALEHMFDNYKDDIMIKDVEVEWLSGDLAMKVEFTDLPTPVGDDGYFELGTMFSGNFSATTDVHIDIFVEEGSGTNLQLQPVIKVSDAWTWSPASEEVIDLSTITQGEWVTITIPVTAFGADDLSDVREILFQYWAYDDSYTGTIYFNDVKLDDEVLFDFNSEGSSWGTAADEAHVSLASVPEATSIIRNSRSGSSVNTLAPMVRVSGRRVNVEMTNASDLKIDVVNLRGKTVAKVDLRNRDAGSYSFTLNDISAGNYILRMHYGNSQANSFITLK